jgi:hypothetical protein
MKWFKQIQPATVGMQSRKARKNTSETTRRRWKNQAGPGVHGYRPQGHSDTKIRIATEWSRLGKIIILWGGSAKDKGVPSKKKFNSLGTKRYNGMKILFLAFFTSVLNEVEGPALRPGRCTLQTMESSAHKKPVTL